MFTNFHSPNDCSSSSSYDRRYFRCHEHNYISAAKENEKSQNNLTSFREIFKTNNKNSTAHKTQEQALNNNCVQIIANIVFFSFGPIALTVLFENHFTTWQLFKFYTMLLDLPSISFLLGVKRKLSSISCLALIALFILCFLINSTQAGVIKKRDTNTTEIPNGGNTVSTDKKTELEPTVLTKQADASVATVSTKLPTVTTESSLTAESSKDFTDNEISLNEAKTLLAESETIRQATNKTLAKTKTATEGDNNTAQKVPDVQQIKTPLESKQKTITDFSELNNNDIKEGQLKNFIGKPSDGLSQPENTLRDNENSSLLKTNFHNQNNEEIERSTIRNESKNETPSQQDNQELENTKPLSKLLTELEERPATILNTENKPLDNSIENSKERVDLKLENKAAKILVKEGFYKSLELTTISTLINQEEKLLESAADFSKIKAEESPANNNTVEISTSLPKITESLEVLNNNSIVPFEDIDNTKQNKTLDYISSPQNQTKLNAEKEVFSYHTTTSSSITNDEVLAFEGDKKQYARSMFVAEPVEQDKALLQPEANTSKPVKLSIQEGIPELKKDPNEILNDTDATTLSIKEKKPKFISDNSTNAQQLNLPNNAEVWSLAAMKSLPKSNITMETTHAHNETLNETNVEHNSSTNLNNNSEKSLLDWSQIMMDKELSSTTRNEVPEANKGNLKDAATTAIAEGNTQQPAEEDNEREDVTTMNSLTQQQSFTTSAIPPVFTTTTISTSSNDKESNNENFSLADKKVEEHMNNYIETLTANFASSTKVDINPFNASLDIEPNLNEINLTSNQTKVDLNNNNVNTTTKATTAGEHIDSDDIKANANIQTKISAVAAAAAETPTTAFTRPILSTTATAVYDDMTTVEQISSETTTVSILETARQNVSLNKVVVIEHKQPLQQQQQQQQHSKNKTNNVNKEESHSFSQNELDNNNNNLLNKNQFNQLNETSDSIIETTTTTTVIPITTFRPTILAITSTTSTFEQEVDQNSNNIQTNLTTTQQQQTIIKFGLQQSDNTTKTILYETTTFETLTTPSTATEPLIIISKNENSPTSSPWENENTTTTTSTSQDVIINETTELNLNSSVATTTQTTPKQEENKYYEGTGKETSTGSAVRLLEKKFENKEYQTTRTEKPTTETNLPASTTTEAPVVVFITEKDHQQFVDNVAPTTESTVRITTAAATTTTKVFTGKNIITTSTANNLANDTQGNTFREHVQEDVQTATTTTTTTTASSKETMNNTQEPTTITSSIESTTINDEETYITLLDDTTTIKTIYTTTTTTASAAAIQPQSTTISTTSSAHKPASIITTTKTSTSTLSTPSLSSPSPSSASTSTSPITTRVEEIYNVINSTTTEVIQTTTQQLLTEIAEESTTSSAEHTPTTTSTVIYPTEILPPATTTPPPSQMLPTNDITRSLPTLTAIMGGNSGNMYTKNSQASGETDVNVIIAITVSIIGVIALILLVGFLYLMRKRQKQTSYSQRCRPVSLDEYTIDNASVGDSMRKSNALRASKRTYGNLAFDDPTLRHNPMGVQELAKFVQEKLRIFEEFRDVPQITSRLDEVPTGCEDKNRYANVLPLPETRVILQRLNDDEKTEYINANYVTGTKDPPNYYIACQAPLESTVEDFWRMIWEQQSRVIIQATDLIENGVEKCAEYLPPSVTLDNHSSFGDFQITLQNREVKDKYAISTLLLKHVGENATREITHYWYKWPENGVPAEEAPIIAMLLEARSSLISYAIEQANEEKEKSSVATLKSAEEGTVTTNNTTAPPTNNSNDSSANSSTSEINGNISMVHIKKAARNQGPLTVHCSPGTGRTGTIIACDIAIRSLETPKRIVDIPQIVYYVRRGRASAVLTKEQYEFIYKVANMYAAKITNPTNYN